ncbi:glycine cleavage system aminomethyltransferase GcvT [Aneurinibacillus terranovensis]|uniref:glycine cleavage system aminomethyltransferase GcvT n=1 Tax=Aneurinibacillus terranovensis TaxID=278991 RepID=UPI000422F2B8|nr:glycine cleavage system aminomethyltransferase GcvT [Aneurinibacillus terranovensis]
MSDLKKTPLHALYKEGGAKTIDFGGWDLPVQFTSIIEEHEAVRNKAGLFDVSHMGEVEVTGPDALSFIQKITTNDAAKLGIGQAQYSIMCYPDGGTVDDLLVYKLADDRYLLVINAANIDKDVAWMQEHAAGDMQLKNISDLTAQLALQGPLAVHVLQKLTGENVAGLRPFHFIENAEVGGVKALVSRSGYTGEDGFELYVKPENARRLWCKILEAGGGDVLPCGLGARDTLRFEARLPLYGQELSKEISPIEAGVGFAVKVDKETPFIGQDVLRKQKAEGAKRKLVGLEMIERGIPRSHYAVYAGEEKIGEVTTGTQSPTLKKNVGLALIKVEYSGIDTEVEVEIRGKRVKAKVVPTPFYKRPKQ